MKIAFLYAGQGSQNVGMGSELYSEYPVYKEYFDKANNIVDFDIKDICTNGPIEVLSKTKYTQPCMVAMAIGITEVLKQNGIVPNAVAGLSLGEYSALYASGVLSLEQVMQLIQVRANAMDKACEETKGSMVAVLGLDRNTLNDVCQKASDEGIVSIANYNCPGQLVIGGNEKAVEKASVLAKENGAKRALPLAVSGAFHTKLMQAAGYVLKDALKDIQLNEMKIPVYWNTLGSTNNDADIKELLEQQVQSSVFFEDIIRSLKNDGIDTIIEIGPGKALGGFVRKTCPDLKVFAVETPKQVEELITAIKGE